MKRNIELDKETNKLVISTILIVIGIALILRGMRQGNLLMLTGLTMMADYFNIESKVTEFTEGLVSLVERGRNAVSTQ